MAKRIYKSILYTLLFSCAFFACLLTNVNVSAESINDSSEPVIYVNNRVTATVTYGFSQEARYGRTMPLSAKVFNKGDTFCGRLAAVLINQTQENIYYEKEVEFTSLEYTSVVLNLPMNLDTVGIQFKIIGEHSETIVDETISLNISNLGYHCFIGILSTRPSELSYFEYFGNKCVHLTKSTLFNDYLSYDALDVIVIDDVDLDQLNSDWLKAIIQWVAGGGNLVIGVDEAALSNIELLDQYQVIELSQPLTYENNSIKQNISYYSDENYENLIKKIKDYESERASVIQYNEANQNMYYGKGMLESISISDIRRDIVSKNVQKFCITNTKLQEVLQDNVIYESIPYGAGTVQIFHFSLANPKLTQTLIELYGNAGGGLLSLTYAGIVDKVMGQLSLKSKQSMTSEEMGTQYLYRLSYIYDMAGGQYKPVFAHYIILLSIYVLVIGPILGTFLFLCKKQKYIWICIPILSAIFFMIMYLNGIETRVKEPYASYLDVEYYNKQVNVIEGTTYANVMLPTKDNNSIDFLATDLVSVHGNHYPSYYDQSYRDSTITKFYDYCRDDVAVRLRTDKTEITFDSLAPFTGEKLMLRYTRELKSDVMGRIFLDATGLKGTLTNQLGYSLNQAYVYIEGMFVDLGCFEDAAQIDLTACNHVYGNDSDAVFYNDNEISRSLGYSADTITDEYLKKVDAIGAIYEEYLYDKAGAFLVGFRNEINSDNPMSILAKSRDSQGLQAVVIPVELVASQGKTCFIPNINRFLKDKNYIFYEKTSNYIYSNLREMEYIVPTDKKLTKIVVSDLFMQSNDDNYNSIECGRVYLYNWVNNCYDLVFDLQSEYRIDELDEAALSYYVSSNQNMKMKYESKNADDSIFILPVISCYMEDADAGD